MNIDVARFVRRIPKVELHVHLEGAIAPELALRLASRRGVHLPGAERGIVGLRAAYRFSTFGAFIRVYLAVSSCLAEVEDFVDAVEDLARYFVVQGVRYAEVTVTPMTHVTRGVAPAVVIEGLVEGRRRAQSDHGVFLRFVFDIVRTKPEQARPTLELARAMSRADGEAVVGLGLGGLETEHEDDMCFERVFEQAKGDGFRSLPHAGELAGPASVWRAIDRLGADRIGHGIRCLEDPVLVRALRDRGIPLEVCPTSNVKLGVVRRLADHPLPRLIDAGLAVSVASDDPTLFGTDLIEEYVRCAQAFGWGIEAIRQRVAAAVDQAFAPPELCRKIRMEQDALADLA